MKVSLLFIGVLFMWSACSKQSKVKTAPAVVDEVTTVQVLTKPFVVPETNLVLPVGTKVKLREDKLQVSVELPTGYGFFTGAAPSLPGITGKAMPVIVLGSYTCKCGDSENRCSVFYLSVGGFGCLHNSCSGVCSGQFVTLKGEPIKGVINLSNAEIVHVVSPNERSASMNKGSKAAFFDQPDVQTKILAEHARLFKGDLMPQLDRIYREKKLQEKYVFVPASLYGVTFYMVAPKTAVEKGVPYWEITEAGPSCSCSGNGHGGCRTEKKSLMGMVSVHWCEGECQACILTV